VKPPEVPAVFVRPPELASMLRMSKPKVYALLADGSIPCTRVGGLIRIPLAWVDKSVADAMRGTEEPSK
jgi:excisionase family DNA binding protein